MVAREEAGADHVHMHAWTCAVQRCRFGNSMQMLQVLKKEGPDLEAGQQAAAYDKTTFVFFEVCGQSHCSLAAVPVTIMLQLLTTGNCHCKPCIACLPHEACLDSDTHLCRTSAVCPVARAIFPILF